MSLRKRSSIAPLLVALAIAPGAQAAVLDPNFVETEFAPSQNDIYGATGLAWAPDGSNRLFIIRKDGAVMIAKNGQVLATPFTRITPIHTGNECGLLGIAFDPDFLNNKYVYFFVTVSTSEQQIIRYTASGDTGTNKTTVVANIPTLGNNHDAGAVGFGPDGKLYWANGDHGNGTGSDADLTSLASKIGRSNRDGTAPGDNPFHDGSGARDLIWARGMRNPFTFAFQPATGLLWVNVVGDNYEQVFVVRKGDHAGDKTREAIQGPGYIRPVIKYRTNGTSVINIRPVIMNGAVRSGGTVTFTSITEHLLAAGEKVTVANVADSSFNGSFFVKAVPSATTFTVTQAGPDATSGSGGTQATATTTNFGGCITGGDFYDSSSAPPEYRGNFFFGDYNNIGSAPGRFMRATIDPSTNGITSVDVWANDLPAAVDIAMGPDGALYYIGHVSRKVLRAAYKATSQGIVVQPLNLWTGEGMSGVVNVSLAVAPTSNVTVTVARSSGDSNISVSAGATLTFTPTNWNVPQIATVTAGADADSTEDQANLSVSASGLTTQTVNVRAFDQASNAFIVSTAMLAFDEGATGTFTVALSQAPAANVSVTVARADGDSDITVSGGATLTFTPANYATPQTVTIAAAGDADNSDDTGNITISAPGYGTRTVAVTARDSNSAAPAITSTAVVVASIGAPYSYDVEATGRPAPTFSLDSTVPGMTINATTGVISWTPTAAGSVMVTVRASNGINPPATQSFTIAVTADQPPTCALTAPANGQTVSGTGAEFYGDVRDDVGPVRGEFHIDGMLAYSDVGTGGHYHFGGGHNLWNTTTLSNGMHRVKLVGVDTAGLRCEVEVSVIVANGGPSPDAGAPADAVAPPADAGGTDAPLPADGGVPGTSDAGRSDAAMTGGTGGTGTGGAPGTGGAFGTGGSTGTGGALGTGGSTGGTSKLNNESGCSCELGGSTGGGPGASLAVALVAAGLVIRRRRRL